MPWEIILTALAFVGGMLFMENRKKRQNVKKELKELDAKVEEGKEDAKRKYEARLARARDAADASVADRPSTDDPVADLRNRLDR